ncbi:hypothetical protein HHI36_014294, partial [Cryptolaemus montrouzieri]
EEKHHRNRTKGTNPPARSHWNHGHAGHRTHEERNMELRDRNVNGSLFIETPQQIEEAIADLETWRNRSDTESSREAKKKQRTHLPANIKALLEENIRAKKKYRRT